MRFPTIPVAACLVVLISSAPAFARAQQSSQSTSTSVPRLIRIGGTFRPADGTRPDTVEAVTLAIYADETGGQPIWQETQSIAVDSSGRYSVLLGASQPDGVPLDVFASGEARWLEMVWGRPAADEGTRTRLTSVPYALRASDADTLGGMPASAYVLAPAAGGKSTNTASSDGPVTADLVLPGTTNFIAKYVNPADVGDSAMFESGGLVGINTTSPADVLHARFTNTVGSMTGIAVQNLGSTATSYSGMLFYDHTGALGQFQGFNNSTKEYRINNIAAGGTINFMIGSTSRFKVNNNGNIDVAGDVRMTSGGDFKPLGTTFYGVRWVDAGGAIQAHMHRFGAVDNRLYVTNAGVSNLTGVYLASGATSWTSTSDERLKTDIEPVTGILDKIKKIRVVSFNMEPLMVDRTTGKAAVNREGPSRSMKGGRASKQQIGSIAQDWIAQFPELVVEPESDDQYYGLNYDRVGVVALGAVKELNELVAQRDAEIQALNERLAALEQMLHLLMEQAEKQPNQR